MIDDKLKTLLAVVRTGGFTKAAEARSLSQPAVSYHIRQLEEENHIKIFYDTKKSPVLTPEGEVLVKYAQRLDNLSQAARQALADVQRSLRHITVGITATTGEGMVARVFAAYCESHPECRVSLVTAPAEELYEKLLSYELDLAIVDGSTPVRRCRSTLLDMDYLSLITSPEHPLARQSSVTLRQLKSEKLIMRPYGADTRKMFESNLVSRQESIRDYNVILEIDNPSVIKELVASNLGVSVMAHSAFRPEEAAGRLIGLPIADMKMVREINVICLDDFNHSETIEEIKRIYDMYH